MLFGPSQPRIQNVIRPNHCLSQEQTQYTQISQATQRFLIDLSQFPESNHSGEVWPDPITQAEINEVFQDQQEFQEDVFQYEDIYESQDFEMSESGEPAGLQSQDEPILPDSSTLSQDIFSTQYSQSNSKVSQQPPIDIDLNFQGVPSSILRFFEASRQNSTDWAFVYALAAQLCHNIYPMNSYVNLKVSLLLSIASIGPDPKKSPMPIVAIGLNAEVASAIMNQVANLADRFVSALVDITGASINKNNCIEAGPLLLAKNGVCYLGDWNMKKNNDSQQVLRALESGRVMIEKTLHPYPLECAVWTYWALSGKPQKDMLVLNQFLNVFGIPIVMETQNEKDLVEYILNQETNDDWNKPNKLNITESDMRTYLRFVSKQEVTISSEAEQMLRDYYVASRINRPNALTQKAFEVLKTMAEAHAKLCFRELVMRKDIVAVVNICEKYIRTIISPEDMNSPVEGLFDSIDDVENHMKAMEEWIISFTRSTLNHESM